MFRPGDKVVCTCSINKNYSNQKCDIAYKDKIYCVQNYFFKEVYNWPCDGVVLIGMNANHPQNCYDARYFRKLDEIRAENQKKKEELNNVK